MCRAFHAALKPLGMSRSRDEECRATFFRGWVKKSPQSCGVIPPSVLGTGLRCRFLSGTQGLRILFDKIKIPLMLAPARV